MRLRKSTDKRLRNRCAGFSMVELLVVVGIVLVISAGALLQIQGSLNASKADTGLQMTLGQMRLTHEMAMDQRKIYRLTFTTPGTIQLDRMDVGAGGALTAVFQSSLKLPAETQFVKVAGMPNGTSGPTPDAMGTAANAIDFGLDYGGAMTQVYFQPDGRALDSVNRVNNGIIYVARPNELYSLRAVTLYGSTGRAKGWRLTQKASAPLWTQ